MAMGYYGFMHTSQEQFMRRQLTKAHASLVLRHTQEGDALRIIPDEFEQIMRQRKA